MGYSKIITAAISTLEKSKNTEWSSGTFEDWAQYARKMKQTISSNIPILKECVSALEVYEQEVTELKARNKELEETLLKLFNSKI